MITYGKIYRRTSLLRLTMLLVTLLVFNNFGSGQTQSLYWTFNENSSNCAANVLTASPTNVNITGSFTYTDICATTTGTATSGSPFISVAPPGNALRNSIAEGGTEYWYFTLSGSDIVKLTNIQVYFQNKRSKINYTSSGSTGTSIQYSVDNGTNWVGSQALTLGNADEWVASTFDFSGISGITSSVMFRIRWIQSSGFGDRSCTADIDNFQVQATLCTPPAITCPPSISSFINPETGLISAYPFNETAGTTAHDFTGNKNGTLTNGPAWGAGKYSNAVYLDGSNDYVSLPAGIVSSLSGNYSISVWVYLNNNNQWSRIFDFGTGTTNYMFLTPRGSTNLVRFAIKTTTGSEQIIDGTAVLPMGGWHHVVITQAGNTGTLYVDGSSVGTNNSMTYHPSALGSTTQNYIGNSQWPDPYLNGRVDEFRIYNVALSGAQVTALYTKASNCEVAADLGSGGLGTPMVTGGCGTVTVTNDALFPLTQGSKTITWTTTDALSNTSNCTQAVTVVSSTVTFTGILADGCVSSTAYALTGGSPAGGTYSGTGVTGTNFNASVAGVGTHTITYTYTYVYPDGTPCQGTATNTIKVNSGPSASVTSQTNLTCYGVPTGEITIQASGGTGPYTFSIHNGDDGYPGSGDPSFQFQNLPAANNYKVRVKDSNGCASPAIP